MGLDVADALASVGAVTLLLGRPVSPASLWSFLGRRIPCAMRWPDWREVLRKYVRCPDTSWARHVGRMTGEYDLLVNCMGGVGIVPRARRAILYCHFPLATAEAAHAVGDYDVLLANSRFTATWMRKRWGVRAPRVLSPPVDVRQPSGPKEPVVLSVARFVTGADGRTLCKGQTGMIRAWHDLCRAHSDLARRWRLVLAGATNLPEGALRALRGLARSGPGRITLLPDPTRSTLRRCYARAALFWHPHGMGEWNPERQEHFGICVVEALHAGAVPIVADAGGPREIVEHGRDGYRVRTRAQMLATTVRLMRDRALRSRMSAAARMRARAYSREGFAQAFRALARDLLSRRGPRRRVAPSRAAPAVAAEPDVLRDGGPWVDERVRTGSTQRLVRGRVRFAASVPEPGPCEILLRTDPDRGRTARVRGIVAGQSLAGRGIPGRRAVTRWRILATTTRLAGSLRIAAGDAVWVRDVRVRPLPSYDARGVPVHGRRWTHLLSLGHGWRRQGDGLCFRGEGRATLRVHRAGGVLLEVRVGNGTANEVHLELVVEGGRLGACTLGARCWRDLRFRLDTPRDAVRVRLRARFTGGPDARVRVAAFRLRTDPLAGVRIRKLAELLDEAS